LISSCRGLLARRSAFDITFATGEALMANCSGEEIVAIWKELRGVLSDKDYWIRVGTALRVFAWLSVKDGVDLLDGYGGRIANELYSYGRWDMLSLRAGAWSHVLAEVLDGAPRYFSYSIGGVEYDRRMAVFVATLAHTIAPYLGELNRAPSQTVFRHVLDRRGENHIPETGFVRWYSDEAQFELPAPIDVMVALDNVVGATVGELRADPTPWSSLVEAGRRAWGERWAFHTLAISLADLFQAVDVPDCDLSDASVPLCVRALRARLLSSDPKWWLRQIDKSRAEGGLLLAFTLLAAHKWMPLPVIRQIEPAISQALEEIDLENWAKIARAVENYDRPRKRQGQDKRQIRWKIGKGMSPRLATLLAARVSPGSAKMLKQKCLDQYQGADIWVLRARADISTREALEKPEAWADALAPISRAYAEGITHLPSLLERPHSATNLRPQEARLICQRPQDFPLYLTSQAEGVLAAQRGAETVPVGKIAARDEWFIEQ
jgi:hypothetical protein